MEFDFDRVVAMIFDEVTDCITGGYVSGDKEITFDTRLVEDLGLDFVDLAAIYGELEDVFNIYFPDEIDEAKTIRDVVEFIMDMVLMEDEDEEEY